MATVQPHRLGPAPELPNSSQRGGFTAANDPRIIPARPGLRPPSALCRPATGPDQSVMPVTSVAMRIASNCGNAYARVGDKARRLFNTAVFSRLAVRDGKIVEYDLRPPFDILFGMPRFEYGSLVELRGIEPLTSSMRPRRSTN